MLQGKHFVPISLSYDIDIFSKQNMGTEGINKRSKLEHYLLTPIIRILSRARDFYMKSMEDCVGKMHGGGDAFGHRAPLSSDGEHLKQLLRTMMKRKAKTDYKVAGFDHLQGQRVVRSHEEEIESGGIMRGRRSFSVWLGQIDEDRPCTFEEHEVLNVCGSDLYPRIRSFALKRKYVNI